MFSPLQRVNCETIETIHREKRVLNKGLKMFVRTGRCHMYCLKSFVVSMSAHWSYDESKNTFSKFQLVSVDLLLSRPVGKTSLGRPRSFRPPSCTHYTVPPPMTTHPLTWRIVDGMEMMLSFSTQ